MKKESNPILFEIQHSANAILYANAPIVIVNNRLYAPYRNFLDFIFLILENTPSALCYIPARQGLAKDAEGMIELPLSENAKSRCRWLTHYHGGKHLIAGLSGIINAFKLLKAIWKFGSLEKPVTVGLPAPTTVSFILNIFSFGRARFFYFVRGDAENTLSAAIQNPLVAWFAKALIRLYRLPMRRSLNKSGIAGKQNYLCVYGSHLSKPYHVARDTVLEIRAVLDEDAYQLGKKLRQERTAWKAGQPLNLVSVGRLSGEKNNSAILRAIHNLKLEGYQLNLVIIGDGPDREALTRLVDELGMADNVQFTGMIPSGRALFDALIKADLYCICSLTEGLPRSVVEALALRVPVAATRVGALPTEFPDSIFFFDGFDAIAIQNGLRKILSGEFVLADIPFPDMRRYRIRTNAELISKKLNEF